MLVGKLHSIFLRCDMGEIPIVHVNLGRSFVESSPQGILLHLVFGFMLSGGKWINTEVSDRMMDGVRGAIF